MQRFIWKRAKPSVITLADRARDAEQWELATGHYRAALLRNPNNPPIWVQYGHVLKESGHLAEAERAYRSAIAYDRRVADSHLQLGYVLKLEGKKEEAGVAFLQAIALDPSLDGASFELAGLGWSAAHLSELREMLSSDAKAEDFANAKVLVFVHIPKCAGTTLLPIITSHYRPADLILGYPNGTDDDLDLSTLLNGHAKCYYGHFYMDIDIGPNKNFVCVSVIRDPVKRIISHYYHIARDSFHWQHRRVIDHGYSLADHALGVDDNNREVDNGQLRQLAGLPGDLTIDEPVFAAARSKILRTYAMVGTTENLNDFVSRLSQLMGWQQPAQYENRNVGNYEAAMIPQEIVRAIRERNKWDQRLYEELVDQSR